LNAEERSLQFLNVTRISLQLLNVARISLQLLNVARISLQLLNAARISLQLLNVARISLQLLNAADTTVLLWNVLHGQLEETESKSRFIFFNRHPYHLDPPKTAADPQLLAVEIDLRYSVDNPNVAIVTILQSQNADNPPQKTARKANDCHKDAEIAARVAVARPLQPPRGLQRRALAVREVGVVKEPNLRMLWK
jgi:hypothetical protein